MNKLQTGPKGRPDFLLLAMTFVLVGFGLVMVFSASSNIAVIDKRYNFDALYFTKRQIVWVGLGTFLMLVLMNFRYQFFKKGFILYFIPVIILLALVPFIGDLRNGARSWLGVGSMGIQPTEFAKLALILYLGRLITKKGEKFREFKRGLLPVMIVVGIMCGLIMLQPDMGAAIILAACAAAIIIAGGSNLKQVFLSGAVVAGVVALIVSIAYAADPGSWQYRIDRFVSFLDPFHDPQGASWQLVNSLYALGHGGIAGVGLGNGVQKLHYLPLAYNDFIFAVIGEEFGFLGSTLFLLFFLFFLWRGLLVSLRCPDVYGTVVGVGIVSLFAIQAVINIGGVIGAMPVTGVTLPFISYGGSSMLVSLASMGILLSISREANRPAQTKSNTSRFAGRPLQQSSSFRNNRSSS
ncbi:putative lipid II flippase FtsW [Paenibacillus sp. 1P07SE]|uniref:putative lipid II flippase FtsW n=1 Tax=Paenibacillus sp. 1P07SE TaxID=3132209 RepID=UPI0039A76A73